MAINETVFPIGCALVIYVGRVVSRRMSAIGERTGPRRIVPILPQENVRWNDKARCRKEVAAGLISKTAREEVHRIQRRHRIWEE